jgi:hypothetical protein
MQPNFPQSFSHLPVASTTLTFAGRWDHFLARWAVNRMGHRVQPGLYRVGTPTGSSPIFVTGNYTLSFDALRSVLGGMDALILVLDTKGVNVWCAAGEGTFGTEELVRRIEAVQLAETVTRRVLVLPQLGAPGMAAHEVKKRTGFRVEYGPVRAADLPEYLRTGVATPEMRRVRFTFVDRMTLVPVEIVHLLLPLLVSFVILYFTLGVVPAAASSAAILAGVILFPALLPWIPTADFSSKGLLLGAVVALPFAIAAGMNAPASSFLLKAATGLALLLALPPVTSYIALNFTGSTTFTSRTGVRTEIYRYIPVMAWLFGAGLALAVVSAVLRAASFGAWGG